MPNWKIKHIEYHKWKVLRKNTKIVLKSNREYNQYNNWQNREEFSDILIAPTMVYNSTEFRLCTWQWSNKAQKFFNGLVRLIQLLLGEHGVSLEAGVLKHSSVYA